MVEVTTTAGRRSGKPVMANRDETDGKDTDGMPFSFCNKLTRKGGEFKLRKKARSSLYLE
jgi:hypothetical protein